MAATTARAATSEEIATYFKNMANGPIRMVGQSDCHKTILDEMKSSSLNVPMPGGWGSIMENSDKSPIAVASAFKNDPYWTQVYRGDKADIDWTKTGELAQILKKGDVIRIYNGVSNHTMVVTEVTATDVKVADNRWDRNNPVTNGKVDFNEHSISVYGSMSDVSASIIRRKDDLAPLVGTDQKDKLTVDKAYSVVFGGKENDTITVTADVKTRIDGGAGADAITLMKNKGADTIIFTSVTDGAGAGKTTGFDEITNFQTSDRIAIGGELLTSIDTKADLKLNVTTRANGKIDMKTDEAVVLSGAVKDLKSTNFSDLITAIGTVSNTSKGADVLILANNGTDSALYHAVDSNGNGAFAAGEITMLGLFKNAILTTASLTTTSS